MKKKFPPQDDIPNVVIIPPNRTLKIELELLHLIPLRKKYVPSNPKSKPKGSDLSHPI